MNSFDKDVEEHMVAHMNQDHVDAMRDYCKLEGVENISADPKMVSVDQYGFNLLVNGENLRIMFKNKCTTPEQVRKALVDLAMQARLKAGQ